MSAGSSEILHGTRLMEYFRDEFRKALLSTDVQISETTEFYIVNLLAGFERSEVLFLLRENRFEEEPLAMMLANALSGDKTTQLRGLKRLGDVALFFAGLFVDHIERGPVNKDYYVDMGSSAYGELSARLVNEAVFRLLYSELSREFEGLTVALSHLTIAKKIATNMDLLKLYDRWIRTGDEKLRDVLIREGLIPTDKPVCC